MLREWLREKRINRRRRRIIRKVRRMRRINNRVERLICLLSRDEARLDLIGMLQCSDAVTLVLHAEQWGDTSRLTSDVTFVDDAAEV